MIKYKFSTFTALTVIFEVMTAWKENRFILFCAVLVFIPVQLIWPASVHARCLLGTVGAPQDFGTTRAISSSAERGHRLLASHTYKACSLPHELYLRRPAHLYYTKKQLHRHHSQPEVCQVQREDSFHLRTISIHTLECAVTLANGFILCTEWLNYSFSCRSSEERMSFLRWREGTIDLCCFSNPATFS